MAKDVKNIVPLLAMLKEPVLVDWINIQWLKF
jgi:hypothetical protein